MIKKIKKPLDKSPLQNLFKISLLNKNVIFKLFSNRYFTKIYLSCLI